MNSKSRITLLVLTVVAVSLAGCGKKQSGGVTTYGSKHTPGDARPVTTAAVPAAAATGHSHTAPNGGELVELGDHAFNLELRYDAARGRLRAWVLDGHAQNFVRVAMASFDVQEDGGARRVITLHATANDLTGEVAGDTSYFEGDAPWLREIKHFDGILKAARVRDVDFRDVKFHFHPVAY
ncbi:MAG: hypothetical protein Q8J74_11370 [Candidatus Didemnitutus sp.]|nr:hypothetical protein [Candidatus Didemnitutus sp.]